MPVEAISERAVRDALRALRYARPLEESPLLGLDLLVLDLRAEGISDTPGSRAWLLGRRLDGWVAEALSERRRALGLAAEDGPSPAGRAGGERTPEQELAAVAADFRAGDAELEAWSALWIRYLAAGRPALGAIAARLGLVERTVERRVAAGQALLADRLRAAELAASREVDRIPGAPARERILVEEPRRAAGAPGPVRSGDRPTRDAPRRSPARATEPAIEATAGALLEVLRGEDHTISLPAEHLAALAARPPADIEQYRLGRVAEWSLPRHRLDTRFVALSLLVDQGETAAGGRWNPRELRAEDLRAVLAELDEPCLVLLGAPGSGKSTLLRRLELDLCIEALRGESAVLTFYLPLNRYRGPAGEDPPPPGDWLAERWALRAPALPPLAKLLADGRMVLLLDGLNEMPVAGPAEYRRRVRAWQGFIQGLAAERPGNRVIFACRSLDYSAPLSAPALRVPQARLEPMRDDQMRRFLAAYAPSQAEALWNSLVEGGQRDLFRTPYFLQLLVDQVLDNAAAPAGSAALFTGFVRQCLRREIEAGNPLFEPDTLLAERDYARLVQARRWQDPHALPERGTLIPALAQLAFAMQARRVAGEAAQVRVDYDEALAMLEGPEPEAERVLRAGQALAVLEGDAASDEILFRHQLLQEYFAARMLARQPDPERLWMPWRADAIRPSLAESAASGAPSDPLPPLPTSGWEETALLAAPMAAEPDAFIRGLAEANLALAGRCALEAARAGSASPALAADLARRLAARARAPEADLRARIAAAEVLGPLGHPELARRSGPQGDYLLPPLVEIPAGRYPIGDDAPLEIFEAAHADHCPGHHLRLAAFALGRAPVSNAEWACFMAAGGYEEPRWWEGATARDWQSGRGTAAGSHANVRAYLALFRANPARMDEELASGRWDEAIFARWQARLAMDEAALEEHLQALFPGGRKTEPQFWRDARFNQPLQPVIGICWHEARAYCAWLAAQSGLPFRLPSEAEWEAGARGSGGRRFAYGEDFDPWRANTNATRLRRPSPTGVFPEGDTPEGLGDMSGNVWEWTASRWGESSEAPDYAYPYDPADGREDPEGPPALRRVVRGGSWYDYAALSTTWCRLDVLPDDRRRISGTGLRLALSR